IKDYFSPFFSPMRYASAKRRVMKTVYNNNLFPTQTGDAIINPENPVNPDSNLPAARIISIPSGHPSRPK
ncbi:MAG: hypothetical protein NWR22_12120, partial [Saprospiraceae bacterium]|nr:hypothetical protein [Saprospiraceae bacterium]